MSRILFTAFLYDTLRKNMAQQNTDLLTRWNGCVMKQDTIFIYERKEGLKDHHLYRYFNGCKIITPGFLKMIMSDATVTFSYKRFYGSTINIISDKPYNLDSYVKDTTVFSCSPLLYNGIPVSITEMAYFKQKGVYHAFQEDNRSV